jgi:hypothetical protein
MAWVVFDRAARIAERFELDPPSDRWKQIRDEIHAEVCKRGYDSERRTFTQYHGSNELDASVLNIPLVAFLPGADERVTGTIDAVSRELARDGFVSRYSTAETDDGLPGDEGEFLACSFWLVSALALNGRVEEARALFERLVGRPMISASSPRSTTSGAGGKSATSHRRSATSPLSSPHAQSSRPRRPRSRRPAERESGYRARIVRRASFARSLVALLRRSNGQSDVSALLFTCMAGAPRRAWRCAGPHAKERSPRGVPAVDRHPAG